MRNKEHIVLEIQDLFCGWFAEKN